MSDYHAVKGGLKLKGSGIVKKKEKKKEKKKPSKANEIEKTNTSNGGEEEGLETPEQEKDLEKNDDTTALHRRKTEAELRFEEFRRKRLKEQVREAKTHKQRVEELNKYLERLSEHHDMPRIGPG
ncbi:DUF1754-domain-containing protein [Piedraia hortae CBS 480.64]|uniref:DUF1754-domain-containing protein n=1 Tax=Piedraia hortae CBS 480.64 TaxID=1314780 RepID=A0A6A7BTA1_9PEZI|nr:DUF1754-domain-containing protein [Piedraia hortae CBS 480.64]